MYLYAFCYGLVTLLTLWAWGPNDASVFWSRTWILGISVLIIGLFIAHREKLKEKLLFRDASLKTIGIAGGIAVGLPLALVIFFSKNIAFLQEQIPGSPGILNSLVLLILVIPAFELFFRGILQPHWGLFGCAFLEALNIGFSTHLFLPFLLVLVLCYLGGFIRERFGFLSALTFRLVWSALVLLSLQLSY